MRKHKKLLIRHSGLFLTLLAAGALPVVADIYSTTVDQTKNGGQWIELGTFNFYGGTGEYIEISNEGANGYVIADAVRLTGNGVTNIIDDADLASSQIYGSWTKNSNSTTYALSYRHDQYTTNTLLPLKWVRFPVDVSQDGTYKVSLWWTAAGNRSTQTPVKVVYNIAPVPHALTVANGSGSGSYIRGTEIPLEAVAPPGAGLFSRWRAPAGSFADHYAPATRFIMPSQDITVTAEYREVLPPVRETARLLPVAAEVDVAVVGSSLGAIGTAVEAAKAGASVMLLCPNSYLGQDMTGENRYWLADGEVPVSGLALELFGNRPSPDGEYLVTPGIFKRQAEEVLITNNVAFLYGTYAVDAVVDGNNNLSGVVIANKGGRQVVRAKVVVDATLMGGFAQTAGAAMEAWPADTPVTVSRTHYICIASNTPGNYFEYTTNVSMTAGNWVERCAAEMRVRRLFDTGEESWSAQYMHVAEPRGIIGEAFESANPWVGAASVNLGICKPQNVDYLYVIGQACSVSRANAAALARPLEMLELGRRLGPAVQAAASARTRPTELRVAASASGSAFEGMDVSESLTGVRPFQQVQRIPQPERTLPVEGRYDVIVVGGGASGAPAAIGAARAGAKVLLVEQLGILGGTGVNGIGDFWYGYRYGFVMEFGKVRWKSNEKAFYFRKTLENAGGEIWYNTLACGVIKSNNTVCGVVVATPMGRMAVLGKVVIDGSGDGDIYAWAGADFEFGCGKNGNFAVQDSGFHGDFQMPIDVQNQSGVYTDPGDIYSATWFRVLSDRYTEHADKFDFYPLSGIRGTRRLVGDYSITALDQYRLRTYADVIAVATTDWDNHGYHKNKACYAGLFPDGLSYIPYRSLLPRGLEGLLVVGRCKSTEHDAMPLVRMQADVGNEGYAAGVAAAMCVKAGAGLRDVDMPALQDHLRAIGNLPNTNICVDMPDPTDAEIQTAIENLSVVNSNGVSVSMAPLLVNPARSIPFLLASFQADPTVFKAKALCFCGDTNGVAYLSDWLNTQTLGPNGGNGRVTPTDSAIRALGYAPNIRAVSALTNKLAACGITSSHYEHVRALVLTLGDIGSPQAVPALLAFLQKPNVTNLVRTVDMGQTAITGAYGYTAAAQELLAATALYRCGDTNGVAKRLLTAYLDDWRGPLRRFAAEVLSNKCTPSGIPYSWFEQHGITTNDYASAESMDSDDDGFSDWQEFWAGTDPRNDRDVFEINGLSRDGQLSWKGGTNVFGTPYRIYGSTNLTAASPWTLTTTVPRANGTNVWQLPETWRQHPQLIIKLTAPTSD